MVATAGSLAVLLTACAVTVPEGPAAPAIDRRAAAAWEALVAAEDARLATDGQVEQVRALLGSGNATLRALAVRALGRSERPEFAPMIIHMLSDPDDGVRAAAAHALGDVSRQSGAGEARRALLEVLTPPGDGGASAAAMTETLGRLQADAASAREVVGRIVPFVTHEDAATHGEAARTGALRGLYLLARQPAARPAVDAAAVQPLRAASTGTARGNARERTIALATLALIRAADEATLAAAMQDPEPMVRREAAAAAGTLADSAAVRRIAGIAARDASPAVRYEAVRVHAARLGTYGCDQVISAVRDTSVHVSLLALATLGTACRSESHAALLDSVAASAGGTSGDWHRAAQATLSLAALDGARDGRRADGARA
ncbi:MAG: HEAT repeat domain-containing protein, partial [Gemmatimonadetes bacterium]|nr:HEAT repeat domain-containing protein [Gemmatimonadota bacterium]